MVDISIHAYLTVLYVVDQVALKIIPSMGSNADPCGHPFAVSFHSLLISPSFTLFCLCSKYEVINFREPSERPYDARCLEGDLES